MQTMTVSPYKKRLNCSNYFRFSNIKSWQNSWPNSTSYNSSICWPCSGQIINTKRSIKSNVKFNFFPLYEHHSLFYKLLLNLIIHIFQCLRKRHSSPIIFILTFLLIAFSPCSIDCVRLVLIKLYKWIWSRWEKAISSLYKLWRNFLLRKFYCYHCIHFRKSFFGILSRALYYRWLHSSSCNTTLIHYYLSGYNNMP